MGYLFAFSFRNHWFIPKYELSPTRIMLRHSLDLEHHIIE